MINLHNAVTLPANQLSLSTARLLAQDGIAVIHRPETGEVYLMPEQQNDQQNQTTS